MYAAGDVGQELIEEIVDRVEAIANKDTAGGGGCVGVNAGDVEVIKLSADGILQQRGVVGHRLAAVAARDDSAGDRIDKALRDASVGHSKVTRVLTYEGWNREGSEELRGCVLQEADAYGLAEALQPGAVGRIG